MRDVIIILLSVTNDVSTELAEEHLVNIHSNLHVIPATCSAQILNSSYLRGESDTSSALDTSERSLNDASRKTLKYI